MPQFESHFFSSLIFWEVVSFAILFWVLYKFAFPAILETLETRERKIRESLDQAERQRAEAERVLREYEAKLGQALYTTLQLLSSDAKRLHFFTRIHDAASGDVIATAEQMMVHVDSKAGKSVEAPAEVLAKIAPIAQAHARLAAPEGAGRSVGQRKAN